MLNLLFQKYSTDNTYIHTCPTAFLPKGPAHEGKEIGLWLSFVGSRKANSIRAAPKKWRTKGGLFMKPHTKQIMAQALVGKEGVVMFFAGCNV